MVSKGAVLGTLVAVTLLGLGAGGYYWTLTRGGMNGNSPIAAPKQSDAGSCGDTDIQATAVKLVKGRGYRTNLLMQASLAKVSALEEADGMHAGSLRQAGDEQAGNDFDSASMQSRARNRIHAMSNAQLKLEAIRTTSIDPNVGSKICTANLTAKLPEDWGQGAEELSYKIEKTSEGDFYVTLLNVSNL
jgi:hypothetical protein